MKKILLFVSVLTISFFTYSQTIPRNKVLVEIATGTW